MSEKHADVIEPTPDNRSDSSGPVKPDEDDFEIFRKQEGVVDFRTVSWQHTSMIFLKLIFATGVLTIPSAMYVLGSFPGAINVLGWQFLNTYCAIVQGNFRNTHAGCHSIADMAEKVGSKIARELAGILFLLAFIIVAASGIVGVSTAFNALSNHALCTNYFSVIAAIMVCICASVRKFENIAWLTWVGFFSVFIAVFVVVVSVTTLDRPAAAPQTGDFELGYRVIGDSTFAAGVVAASTIFCSGAGTSAFLPVISEMKRPRDYSKAVYVCMGFVTASYLTFSLVVYRWCGQWVASPSLGSGGPVMKKVAFGIGLVGLCISAALYIHVGAKYIFVRILRNSKHLQQNSIVHWGTWMGCTIGLTVIAFLVASGIPIFNYILALAGSLCFAPLALSLPGWLWLYDHASYRKGTILQKLYWVFNVLVVLIGLFMLTGGTYGVIEQIREAYRNGTISSAFSCADNSNSS
ncbi:hypothetical protein C1H76_5327 [Elsinoe australis]|uniref:Amino acid transporter transmembrane domain-containing protein n=1 Tax=Elsinoe australis TaxID=40998 RepID=A0A4U7B388_9PEZI|nr:hypothetical protein C1H76_5327 [Elsinoe australis]